MPFVRRGRALAGIVLVWFAAVLAAAPVVASPAADKSTFTEALYLTTVGPEVLAASRARSLLRALKLRPETDALALELTHRYPGRLNGAPPEPGLTLGALISAGKSRGPVTREWLAALQQGIARSVTVAWPGPDVQTPGTLDPYIRVREVLAPGVWRVPFEMPRVYVTFDLLNHTALPLPLVDLSATLPGEQGSPRYDCKFEMTQDESRRNEPAWKPGERKTMLCSRAAPLHEAASMLVAIDSARASGQAPLLSLTGDAKTAATQVERAVMSFWSALPVSHRVRNEGVKWRPSELPMGAPQPVPTLAERWNETKKAHTGFVALTVASLMLFMVGRVLQRIGWPSGVVYGLTIAFSVVAAGFVAASVSGPEPSAGEGWQRGATLGLIAIFGAGFVLFGALMLHALHRRLDADNLSWFDAVLSGWRNAFRLKGTATSGEFWGFYAHAVWLLVLVRGALRPWDVPISALILVAMMTMAKRRMAAIPIGELVASVAALLLYAASYAIDP